MTTEDFEGFIREWKGQHRQITDLSGDIYNMLVQFDQNSQAKINHIEGRLDELRQQKRDKNISSETRQAIQAERKKLINEARDLIKKRKSITFEDADKFARFESKRVLGGRATYNFETTAKSMSQVGSAFEKLGFKTLGSRITSVAGGLTKFAGPLGIVTNILNAAGAALKFFANQVELDTKEIEANNTAQKARLALGTRLTQAELNRDATIVSETQIRDIELASEAKSILNESEVTAQKIGRESLFDVKGSAFAAAEAAISRASKIQKFNVNELFSGSLLNLTKTLETLRFATEKTKGDAESNEIETKLKTDLDRISNERGWSYAEGGMSLLNTLTMGVSDALLGSVVGGAKSLNQAYLNQGIVKEMFGAEIAKQFTDAIADLNLAANEKNVELQKRALETLKKIETDVIDAAEQMKKAALKMTDTVYTTFQKAETAAYKLGRELGFSGDQLAKYAQGLSHTQVVVSKWGKTLEDMQKMQSAYQQSTGRNRDFSDADFDKSFALGLLVGDDTVAQLNEGMEIFNKSIADSNEKFYEMYKQTTKMGLSGVKYTKDLAKNLRLAEKYNFKNGVQGLMDMSKWAQNVRFNTESLDGMLEKVQTGGLEGIIKQSAELQVLGGNFAMGSDPLAMAYEAHMNPAAYAKRMNRMLTGQGMFDSKTGEVSFGIASQIMMRQYAQSTGQNYQDVLNQSRQAVRMEKVGAAINPREAFTDEQKALITNKAEYVNGQWQVNVGKDNDGKDIIKNVGQVSQADVEAMTPIYDNKPMEENISRMRGSAEEMVGLQTKTNSILQKTNWETFVVSSQRMIENVAKNFKDNLESFNDEIKTNMETIVRTHKGYLDQFNTSLNDPMSIWSTVGSQLSALVGTDPKVTLSELTQKFDDFLTHAQNAKVGSQNYVDKLGYYQNPQTIAEQKDISSKDEPSTLPFLNNPYYQNIVDGYRRAHGINDGIVAQNGTITKIDSQDQVLAAKENGPISKLLNNIDNRNITYSSMLPSNTKPLSVSGEIVNVLPSGSQVIVQDNASPSTTTEHNTNNSPSKLEIPPIQLVISGNIQVGANTLDLSQQINNDPMFARALTQMIMTELTKKQNGGKTSGTLA